MIKGNYMKYPPQNNIKPRNDTLSFNNSKQNNNIPITSNVKNDKKKPWPSIAQGNLIKPPIIGPAIPRTISSLPKSEEENTYKPSTNKKTFDFAMRHPFIANQIGEVKTGVGYTNISTNSTRFANAFGLSENDAGEGSQVNAFRHTLWQATIAKRFGADIAKEVGDAHELNPDALDKIKDPYNHQFSSLSDADEVIDLMNNDIGRDIGNSMESEEMKDISRAILEHYYTNGLNVAVENEDGGYSIEKETLTEEQYLEALEIGETLDKHGFPPDNEYYNKKK